MRWLSEKETKDIRRFFEIAAETAAQSTCLRSKCGSVIVKNNEIIGKGYNSPPGDCALTVCLKDYLPENFKSDKTCCVHAEQRAIKDALIHNADNIQGSRLYFVRLGETGMMTFAGDPYCTICSKETLDAGIGEFVLWHKKGVCVYNAQEYNEISFNYRGE